MVELRGPSQTIYLVEDGVLDQRAWAAFSFGQCHGLALALSADTGWPLVAVHSEAGTCDHICVRRPDSKFVDINGTHTQGEFEESSPGCTFALVDEAEIDRLVDEEGWAPPAVDAANSFVEATLARAAKPPGLPASKGAAFRTTRESDQLRMSLVWKGFAWIEAYVQYLDAAEDDWTLYGNLRLPKDSSRDAYVVDFTAEEFERLVEAFLDTQFDLERALDRLSTDGAAR